MVDRRVRHLARTFQLIALAVGVPVATTQCSPSSGTPVDPGTRDATVPGADTGAPAGDGSTDGEAALADSNAPSADASDGGFPLDAGAGCFGTVLAIDGGPDAEELCDYTAPCGLNNYGLGNSACVVLPTYGDGGLLDAAAIGWPYCHVLEGYGCTDGSFTPTEAGVTFECVGCPGVAVVAPRGGVD